jgi:hypothetical protein
VVADSFEEGLGYNRDGGVSNAARSDLGKVDVFFSFGSGSTGKRAGRCSTRSTTPRRPTRGEIDGISSSGGAGPLPGMRPAWLGGHIASRP